VVSFENMNLKYSRIQNWKYPNEKYLVLVSEFKAIFMPLDDLTKFNVVTYDKTIVS